MDACRALSATHDPSDSEGYRKHEEEPRHEKVDVARRKLEARSNEIRPLDQPESNNQVGRRNAPELPFVDGPEEGSVICGLIIHGPQP